MKTSGKTANIKNVCYVDIIESARTSMVKKEMRAEMEAAEPFLGGTGQDPPSEERIFWKGETR